VNTNRERGFYWIKFTLTTEWEIALWHTTPHIGWHWSIAGSNGIIKTIHEVDESPINRKENE
jgi:hypothetical protein